jgi:DNA invertase Pin-like site-specific DNA recombinase
MNMDIYIGVSRVAGREGESYRSPKQQEQACRAWAEVNEVEVGTVEVEEDVSGGKKAASRKLSKLLKRIDAEVSDGIITYRLNGFGRNMADTVNSVVAIKDSGARFVSVAPDSSYDTAQAGGEVMLGVLSGLAEQ